MRILCNSSAGAWPYLLELHHDLLGKRPGSKPRRGGVNPGNMGPNRPVRVLGIDCLFLSKISAAKLGPEPLGTIRHQVRKNSQH